MLVPESNFIVLLGVIAPVLVLGDKVLTHVIFLIVIHVVVGTVTVIHPV
jgi:hypothetical protein